MFKNNDALNEDVAVAMQPPLPAVDADASLDEVYEGLSGRAAAVVVASDGKPTGISRAPTCSSSVRAADAGRRRLDVFRRAALREIFGVATRDENRRSADRDERQQHDRDHREPDDREDHEDSEHEECREDRVSMMVVMSTGSRRARRQTLRGLDRLGTRLRLRPRGARA